MVTWSSNALVAEKVNSAKEQFDNESGISASVVLQCPWADRHDVVAEILTARMPWPYGSFANPPKAHSCAVKMLDNAEPATYGQGLVYAMAELSFNFSTKAKELVSETIEPTAEFLSMDWRRFRWGAANGEQILEAESPGQLRLGMNLVRTLHEVAGPLPVSLLTLPGSCNDADYTSALLGITFLEETLLFQPPNMSRVIKTDGDEGFTLKLSFVHKPSGWNKFWRAKTQSYEEMFDVNGGGGRFINYPPDDYSDFLF